MSAIPGFLRGTQEKKWGDLTLAEREYIVQLFEGGDDLEPIAASMGMKSSSLQRWIYSHKSDKKLFLGEAANRIIGTFPELPQRRYDDHIVLESDNFLVTSDWELEDTDGFMMRAALLVAMKHGIKTHIFNGDLVSHDQPGINSFDPMFAEDIPNPAKTMYRATRQVIRSYGQWFNNQYLTYGNHENKLNRTTKGQLSVDEMLYEEDIDITYYAHLWVKTSRGWAHISHPGNYSKNSVVLGRQIYNVTLAPGGLDTGEKPRFIVIGHTHSAQEGHSEDGWAEIYGLGCMRNPQKAAYKERQVKTFPAWNQSFVMFKDGYVTHYDRRKTNWRAELGDLYEQLVA